MKVTEAWSNMDHVLIDAFVNAVQLSIQSKIVGSRLDPQQGVVLAIYRFKDEIDENLKKLDLLLGGRWEKLNEEAETEADTVGFIDHDVYIIPGNGDDLSLLTSFLLLTRLKDDEVRVLAKHDRRYRPLAQRLGLIQQEEMTSDLASLDDAARIIFSEIEKQSLTLREVSEKTGLTQAMLSHFKKGRDLRLSSLLKIVEALGLKLGISN